MKKMYLIFMAIMLVLATHAFAQSPQGINYQAVVRDGNGAIIANQAVSFRMSVLEDSAMGNLVFQETHAISSNNLGLVNLQLGQGSTASGDFSLIDWGGKSHYLRVEFDASGGSSYLDLGTTQFLSVPYSLYAEQAGSVPSVDDADADPSNELQTLSISNDTITLTDGGFVKLSGATVPDTALPVPIAYHGSQIFVHPTDNASNVDWATAQTTCSNLVAFGFSDWELPSRLELDAMHKQSYHITGLSQTASVKYWSNTEFDLTNAFSQRLDYGGPDPDPKTESDGHNCRCIRR